MLRDIGRRSERTLVADEAGTATVEFTLVSALLTVLTLAVVQLGLALHIRNTLLDAAAEGARVAALVGSRPADGTDRTRALIETAIGESYAQDITVAPADYLGHPAIAVTVRTALPLIGLVGIPDGLEVTGHAALEGVG